VLDPVKKKTRTGGGRSQPERRSAQATGGTTDGLLRQRPDRETVCSDSERIETPLYGERRVIGRRQLDGRRRRSAETAEDSSQHTGKILGVVVAEKERREWGCSRVRGSYCLSSYLLLIVSL
jgi:hypothetical protein